ncbi:hypothetical protein C3B51_14895 [Pseudoalteromonas rubra]|uniref:Transposase IS4-like domain-containing protein n=1 Tax=Pseudoalteromonas rubra TaxID=43658 RepID=A0A4Q7E5Y7_9GAMM|nr:hypothetical protein C3B51_14895 [Pseudoalteromonas rubra]
MFSWVNEQRSQSGKPIIAFDGKALRGASKKREVNLHLVSAFDCESGLTLYQRTVESKSNEIPARSIFQILSSHWMHTLSESDTLSTDFKRG